MSSIAAHRSWLSLRSGRYSTARRLLPGNEAGLAGVSRSKAPFEQARHVVKKRTDIRLHSAAQAEPVSPYHPDLVFSWAIGTASFGGATGLFQSRAGTVGQGHSEPRFARRAPPSRRDSLSR